MAGNDWQYAGEQIRKLVQDAVDTRDFSTLSNTISNVVNDTVSGLQSSLKENLNYSNRDAAERIRRNLEQRRRNKEQANTDPANEREKNPNPDQTQWGYGGRQMNSQTNAAFAWPVIQKAGAKAGMQKWMGYCLGLLFGLTLAASVFIQTVFWTPFFGFSVPTAVCAILTGGSFLFGASGSRRQRLLARFGRYRQVLGERTYCRIDEMAAAVGAETASVRKDLKELLRMGCFTEGYLDKLETVLITDRSTYEQYMQAQTGYEQRRAQQEQEQEKRRASSAPAQAAEPQTEPENSRGGQNLPPECREIIEEGQRYIQHIRECNDRLPQEAISAKLSRLELVITRIFRELERNPEIAGDLKKLMSYYLPTTRKLLDVYCELDGQPIHGQNVENTKKEIEDALDTINQAFENLLDSLFQDQAWDVSSDISVLNTMLAQEGLMGSVFEKKQNGRSTQKETQKNE